MTNKETTMENFKDINGYNGLYKISNFGNVKSLISKKILKTIDNGKGYKTVNLYKNNKAKRFYIHRLVGETFIREIPKDMNINHKDGNKSNNNLSNLEIVTFSENLQHAHDTKLRKSTFGKRFRNSKTGFSNICSKFVRGKFFWNMCIRTKQNRFEKCSNNIYDMIVLHNQIMRSLEKEDKIHNIEKHHIDRYGTGLCSLIK